MKLAHTDRSTVSWPRVALLALLSWWTRRDVEPFTTPGFYHLGPKAVLMNGYSSSGGDAFPFYMRQQGLATLIGTLALLALLVCVSQTAIADIVKQTRDKMPEILQRYQDRIRERLEELERGLQKAATGKPASNATVPAASVVRTTRCPSKSSPIVASRCPCAGSFQRLLFP